MLKFVVDEVEAQEGMFVSVPFGKTKGEFIDLYEAMVDFFDDYMEDRDHCMFSQFLKEFIKSDAPTNLGWRFSNANEFFVLGLVFGKFVQDVAREKKEREATHALSDVLDKIIKELDEDVSSESEEE